MFVGLRLQSLITPFCLVTFYLRTLSLTRWLAQGFQGVRTLWYLQFLTIRIRSLSEQCQRSRILWSHSSSVFDAARCWISKSPERSSFKQKLLKGSSQKKNLGRSEIGTWCKISQNHLQNILEGWLLSGFVRVCRYVTWSHQRLWQTVP